MFLSLLRGRKQPAIGRFASTRPGTPRHRRLHFRPRVEKLEERTLLSFGSDSPLQINDSDLTLSSSSIQEGDAVTLAGIFTDFSESRSHSVAIDWGDRSPATVVDLTGRAQAFQASHQYVNNATAERAIPVAVANEFINLTAEVAVSAELIDLTSDVVPIATPNGFRITVRVTNDQDDTAWASTVIDVANVA